IVTIIGLVAISTGMTPPSHQAVANTTHVGEDAARAKTQRTSALPADASTRRSLPGTSGTRTSAKWSDNIPDEHAYLRPGIGFLFRNGRGPMCTAFCIADRVIATAAHCLYRRGYDNRADQQSRMSLRLPRQDGPGEYWARAGVSRISPREIEWYNLSGDYQRPRQIDASTFNNDWALARIDTPICQNHALPVAHGPERGDIKYIGDLFMIGQHNQRVRNKLWWSTCSLLKTERRAVGRRADYYQGLDNLFLHNCDGAPGSSGSPIFADFNGTTKVIGVHVGRSRLRKEIPGELRSVGIANTLPLDAFNFHRLGAELQ
ncbi:MAG: trypsin-like serine protease, partial [Pseudomonadota bacterium]